MPAESELWDLVASRREGVLATIKRGGLPQLQPGRNQAERLYNTL
jgi:hypothetical protein